jgi:hypothetical protein
VVRILLSSKNKSNFFSKIIAVCLLNEQTRQLWSFSAAINDLFEFKTRNKNRKRAFQLFFIKNNNSYSLSLLFFFSAWMRM